MPYFFGIKTPIIEIEELRNIISQIRKQALPIEPVAQDSLHLTILYVGRRLPKRDVFSKIASMLSKVGEIKFKITNSLDLFPSISKPRALVLKVEDRYGKLREIRRILIDVLKQHNATIEDKFLHEFNPHITIGHIRAKLTYAEAVEILNSLKITIPELTVRTQYIELIDSTGGAYRVLTKFSTLPQTQDQDTL